MRRYFALFSKKDGVEQYTIVFRDRDDPQDLLYVDSDFCAITSQSRALTAVRALNGEG